MRKLLASNDEVKVQVIFAEDPDSEYYKQMPIDTFLSLYYEGGDVAEAISEWFDGKFTDAEEFKKKYPVSQENTQRNRDNAKAMAQFCEAMEITATPTMYINGNQLPDGYRTGDLIYFY